MLRPPAQSVALGVCPHDTLIISHPVSDIRVGFRLPSLIYPLDGDACLADDVRGVCVCCVSLLQMWWWRRLLRARALGSHHLPPPTDRARDREQRRVFSHTTARRCISLPGASKQRSMGWQCFWWRIASREGVVGLLALDCRRRRRARRAARTPIVEGGLEGAGRVRALFALKRDGADRSPGAVCGHCLRGLVSSRRAVTRLVGLCVSPPPAVQRAGR